MQAGCNKRLKGTLGRAISTGWRAFLWMMKIIIPVSFATSLVAWSGCVDSCDFLLDPVMALVGLPSIAALPLLIGILAGPYGAIASMAVLPLTVNEMTLIAVFLLMAHNLIQEGIIQGNSGYHPVKATLVRLLLALLTLFIAAHFVDTSLPGERNPLAPAAQVPLPFMAMAGAWLSATGTLTVKVFCIIMAIVTFQEILKDRGWISPFVRSLSPFLRIMGLSEKVGFLWMTAVLFGLSYGGALIVEETRGGALSRNDLETLHLSIGINHSLIEDPVLYLPLGISPFWLWVPRLAIAIVVVRLFTIWQTVRQRWRTRSVAEG